jgi:hypothetical protein
MSRMHRIARPVIVIAWLIFLVGPLAFVFAPAGELSRNDELFGLYMALQEVLGEHSARWIFGALWLAMNAALFWRYVLTKKSPDINNSLELHD